MPALTDHSVGGKRSARTSLPFAVFRLLRVIASKSRYEVREIRVISAREGAPKHLDGEDVDDQNCRTENLRPHDRVSLDREPSAVRQRGPGAGRRQDHHRPHHLDRDDSVLRQNAGSGDRRSQSAWRHPARPH